MQLQASSKEAKVLRLKSGRKLCYSIIGPADGLPVYFFHGFPGSRLQSQFVEAQIRALGICLVSFDRPGFGLSDPQPGRSILSICDDVVQLADSLQHSKFGVVGVSCGGAYALASAANLKERVVHAGLLGGMGPMDLPAIRKEQLKVLTFMFKAAAFNSLLAAPLLALDGWLFRRNPEKAVQVLGKMLSAPDQKLLQADPVLLSAFTMSLVEAYRQGTAGVIREANLIGSPRPYGLGEISAPVDVWQGLHDRHVPSEMGRFIARSVQQGRFFECPEDGHLSVVITQFTPCIRRIAASFQA